MKNIRIVPFLVAVFLFFDQTAYAVFTDVRSDYKYYTAISYLQEHGIVEGYADGSFRPDQEVNRAEALKIILLGSNILVPEIQEQEIFPDVPFESWYAKYAAKARNLGIVSGDSHTGMFRPGDTVNLAEILKILLNTNGIETAQPEAAPYADVPADSWFSPYFAYAFSISLLPQKADEEVKPSTPVTRGLMAQLMYQLELKPEGYQEGKATYYGENFHGRGTASGEVFDASAFTAAHRSLPFGTWLKVKNLDNDKETYVRVNDRGPYGDDERIIDLSTAAFAAIAPLSQGVARVSITPVSGPPGGTAEPSASSGCLGLHTPQSFDAGVFENITLSTSLPNIYLADEVLSVTGTSKSGDPNVSAFLADPEGRQYSSSVPAGTDGTFSVNLFFPGSGEFKFGVLPGLSGTSVVGDLTVLSTDCLSQSENGSLPAPTNLKLSLSKGDTVITWQNDPSYNLNKLSFTQGARRKEYLIHSASRFIPHYPDFEGWSTGAVQLEIRGSRLDDASLAEAEKIDWSPPLSASFTAQTHHVYTVENDKVSSSGLPSTLKAGTALMLKVDPKVNLDALGKIILPSGLVEELSLTCPTHSAMTGSLGISIFPSSATDVRLSFTPKSNALHFFEINDEQGIAAVNIPVYPENTFPLLPNPVDLSDLKPVTLSSDLGALRSEMLKAVNADRAAYGLPALTLNTALNQLAQSRSNDMAERGYFGHWNPDGLTANDLRKDFAIAPYVSENIARDVNIPLAQYGLMRSASHRSNILNKEWKRAGFGFTQDGNNGTLFVQIFSDDPINLSDVGNLRDEILGGLNAERASALSLQNSLNSLAQNWSDKMAADNFDDFNSPSGESFFTILRDSGVTATSGALIIGNSSFEGAKEQILKNDPLKETRWKNLGIGITQDSLGIIKVMLVYTE